MLPRRAIDMLKVFGFCTVVFVVLYWFSVLYGPVGIVGVVGVISAVLTMLVATREDVSTRTVFIWLLVCDLFVVAVMCHPVWYIMRFAGR